MTLKRQRPRRRPTIQPQGYGETQATNPALRAAVLQLIEKQLTTGNPPETGQTLERLVAAGYSREGAINLIATAVVSEIFDVMARGEAYDAARYYAALARLPRLPGEEDEPADAPASPAGALDDW